MIIIWITIVVILSIIFFVWRRKDQAECIERAPFVNVWDKQNRKLVEKIIEDTDITLFNLKIDYFATFGTLLGAVRHGDLIPWDDDVDLHVDRRLEKLLPKFIKEMRLKGYHISTENEYVPYKIYHEDGIEISGKSWRWPFIDLFLFDLKEEMIVLNGTNSDTGFSRFKREAFLPIRRARFGTLKRGIAIPNDPSVLLIEEYGKNYLSECVSSSYNHRKEKRINKIYKEQCARLNKPNIKIDTLPAFVINLDRRTDRWEHIEVEMSKIGIEITRVSAIDANSLDFQRVYATLPMPHRTAPEVACAFSHLKALRMFLETDFEYGLIFEDDIVFPNNLTIETLDRSFQNARGMKLLLLGHCYSDIAKRCNTSPGSSFIAKGLCLHAYIVSREGAHQIIESYRLDEPIDVTTQKLCKRTGGLCYISGDTKMTTDFFGNGLVFQLDVDTDIPKRGLQY